MAATLFKECPSCGRAHPLFLRDGECFDANALYEYVCPTTQKAMTVQIDAYVIPTDDEPIGAVAIHEVDAQMAEKRRIEHLQHQIHEGIESVRKSLKLHEQTMQALSQDPEAQGKPLAKTTHRNTRDVG